MTRYEFNSLAKRYLEGNTSEEENQYLAEWLKNQSDSLPEGFDKAEMAAIESRIWQKINSEIEKNEPIVLENKNKSSYTVVRWLSGIAACLLLLMLWFETKTLPTVSEEKPKLVVPKEREGIELRNTTLAEQEVKLEDGTVILLEPNTKIIYDKHFNQAKREIFLEGDAFFKVKRDVTKPFIVHSGALVTEVLGTSFTIKESKKAKSVEVAVRSGKVSVYLTKPNKANERQGIILTPNQRVVYDEIAQNITSSLVENPIPLTPIEENKSQVIFKTTPLPSVLNKLSSIYGIEFVITNPKIQHCKITADLSGLTMFTQLELICKSIDATYEKRGMVVFIDGDGCD